MKHSDITYKIRGSIYDIYNNVIGVWSEKTFENILFYALAKQGLQAERQKEYAVYYKDNKVGLYRTDLVVEDKVIIELKVVPEIFALHIAQTISYLKVTGLDLAILVNFGGEELYLKSFPNNVSQKRVIETNFDISKINLDKNDIDLIAPYLNISREILEILGPGYFHQVYRRAFWDELHYHSIGFEWIKELELEYQGEVFDKKEMNFFKINDLLISIVAIGKFNNLVLKRFAKYINHFKCEKGLIINFNSTFVDFRYLR